MSTKYMDKAQHRMDYVAIYPDTYIRIYASDMILSTDSDAAYQVHLKQDLGLHVISIWIQF